MTERAAREEAQAEVFALQLAHALDEWTWARPALQRIAEYVQEIREVDITVRQALERLAAGLLEAWPELGEGLGDFAHATLTSCLAQLCGIDAVPGVTIVTDAGPGEVPPRRLLH